LLPSLASPAANRNGMVRCVDCGMSCHDNQRMQVHVYRRKLTGRCDPALLRRPVALPA